MWIGENESAEYWATVFNSLNNRCGEDIFIACIYNLTGFNTAIRISFLETEMENCIIHQLHNSSKYVSYENLRIYAAMDKRDYPKFCVKAPEK